MRSTNKFCLQADLVEMKRAWLEARRRERRVGGGAKSGAGARSGAAAGRGPGLMRGTVIMEEMGTGDGEAEEGSRVQEELGGSSA
jgi:hypothetical protein